MSNGNLKRWVETRLIEPPDHSVMGRFGCSVMQVAYLRMIDQWVWLQPYGVEEKIPEPEKIFVGEDYIREHTLATPRGRREKPTRIRRGKQPEQLSLL